MVESEAGVKVIAFGCSLKEAQAYAKLRLDDEDNVETMQRCPPLDVFTPGPAPMAELIEVLGFTFFCLCCSVEITEDLFDYRRGVELKPVYDDEAQVAFCSSKCAVSYAKNRKKQLH